MSEDIKIGRDIIRVEISDFKDKQYLNVRRYYEDDSGEWKPTPKGISIPVEIAPEVISAIQEVWEDFSRVKPKKKKSK